MRIAAIGDIHCNSASYESMPGLFAQIAKQADMLLMCGDIVDYGLPEEAVVIAKEISNLRIPVLAVLVLNATEFQVGVLTAANVAAFLVVGLPAGAWIDRMRKLGAAAA